MIFRVIELLDYGALSLRSRSRSSRGKIAGKMDFMLMN